MCAIKRERENLTNALISEALEKLKRIERRKIAGVGLPVPQGQIANVGFSIGYAIPALEDLLAGVAVARSDRRIVDPGPFGVIAGAPRSLSLASRTFESIFFVLEERRNVGVGGSGNGEDENEGGEAEEREGEEGGGAPKGDVLPFWVVPQRHQRREINAING